MNPMVDIVERMRSQRPKRASGRSREAGGSKRSPQNHRTVDRVTRILEEVVYKPGLTFAELVRTLGAAKSSVHGFIRGLIAQGWLYETDHRFYLGPAVYSLTLASGHIRAGLVTHEDLVALQQATGVAVFLGVQAGEHLIYIAEAGSDHVAGFEARSNIRRTLLITAGGKALLAERPVAEREAYLRRRGPAEKELVDRFLGEYEQIRKTRIATNVQGTGRFGLATTVHNQAGQAVASITLVGPTSEVQPRVKELSKVLLRHVDSWAQRSTTPREAI
jgi:DNA-binding IclR family transcriptional regulator